MSNLYTNLASVYQAMYQSFIDYEQEYHFYSEILNTYSKCNVLEIGCGTGNLALHFIRNNFKYMGLDLSNAMLSLAKNKNLKGTFLHGDMRNFQLNNRVESMIITGRTINYLVTNHDVNDALACMHENLTNTGVICFDFIDAAEFVPMIQTNKKVNHEATFKGSTYKRKSTWDVRLKNGWDLEWRSVYYKKEGLKWLEIGTDIAIVRTFTIEEIEHFLKSNGFKLEHSYKRASYAFPTYVVVAKKIQT